MKDRPATGLTGYARDDLGDGEHDLWLTATAAANRADSGDRPQRIAFARSAPIGGMSGLKRKVVRQRRPAEYVAYALRTRVPDMSPNCHQLPTIATISYLRT